MGWMAGVAADRRLRYHASGADTLHGGCRCHARHDQPQRPTSYKLFTLSNPERVVIDLSDARLATSLKGLNYSGTLLTSIRSGPRPNGGLRLVLDVAVKTRPKAFLLQPADAHGLRQVVGMPTST